MKKLIKYLKPYWFFALLSPLLMVGEVVADLFQPALLSNIVDEGIIGGSLSNVISIGVQMILIVLAGGFCGMAASYFASVAAQSFGCDLRKDVFDRVMHLSVEQTDKFTTGSLVTRMTNDITMVQDLVSMALRMFIRAPLSFAGGIVMALSLNIKFAWVLVCALPLELIVIILMLSKAAPLFSQVQSRLDRVNSVVQENVTGARVVKAYVREEHEIERFDDANVRLRDVNLKVQKLMATISPLMMLFMNAAVVAIILIGHFEVQAGAMQVGKIMAGITYVTQILMSLMMVSMMFQSISRASASAKRIIEVLDSSPVVVGGDNSTAQGSGAVSFRGVGFHYPATVGRPVLNNIDLDIKPGEYIAVLGATGSGKSSLINLIPRFYDTSEGRVTVDGIDVRDYNIDALRSKIGCVLQKSELFAGTVADNIRWGRPDATDEEVVAAAKLAQADEFITTFADGYSTMISEKGASLSGGQKQRLSIARAVLRHPEILIFDDSTSALDLGTEARLRTALRENMRGTTIIMIAQRIASVMTADRIAVIENGAVTACAPHAVLMKESAAYRDIYNSQMRNGGAVNE
ncbi:MAG: ABC transporter ATP-binding protein [Eubacteriales bacterium]